jgi:hypothetical protein
MVENHHRDCKGPPDRDDKLGGSVRLKQIGRCTGDENAAPLRSRFCWGLGFVDALGMKTPLGPEGTPGHGSVGGLGLMKCRSLPFAPNDAGRIGSRSV